jgi:hypothetical protein
MLHGALSAALTDIVERWWTATDARFPDRMPLLKKEEDRLKVCFADLSIQSLI